MENQEGSTSTNIIHKYHTIFRFERLRQLPRLPSRGKGFRIWGQRPGAELWLFTELGEPPRSKIKIKAQLCSRWAIMHVTHMKRVLDTADYTTKRKHHRNSPVFMGRAVWTRRTLFYSDELNWRRKKDTVTQIKKEKNTSKHKRAFSVRLEGFNLLKNKHNKMKPPCERANERKSVSCGKTDKVGVFQTSSYSQEG